MHRRRLYRQHRQDHHGPQQRQEPQVRPDQRDHHGRQQRQVRRRRRLERQVRQDRRRQGRELRLVRERRRDHRLQAHHREHQDRCNGKEFTANGETNVRAGTEYKVTTERPTLNINVKELDAGSWVMFELPGFTTASAGTVQSSLDALRTATATSYYKGNGELWVKVVSTGDILGSGPANGPGGGVSLQASR